MRTERADQPTVTAPPASVPTTLPRLTSLRAFAAGAVVVYHLERWEIWRAPTGIFSIGYTGVAFFFVLSGFVLGWGHRPGLAVGTFYRRRFARVYPSHLVMLVVAALVPVVAVSVSRVALVPNLLLVQAWVVRDDVVYGFNGVSWSLSCEAFFYVVFPFAYVVLRRAGRTARWAVPAALVVATGVAGGLAGEGSRVAAAAFSFPPARLAEFLVGVAAAIEMRNGWRPRLRAVHVVAAFVVATLVAVRLPYPSPDAVMVVPSLLLILWGAARDVEGRRGVLTTRGLVYAGEVSFALYLVHELVMIDVRSRVHGTALTVALVTVLSLGAAVALHHAVERPCQRLLRHGVRGARHPRR